MMALSSYLAQDRRRALARGENLPDRTHGSVLFADISGFTPFTEALRHVYGARRGAEEMSNHLDAVYTSLIGEVERYGGSVTGFAGDGMTCWFGDGDGGRGAAVRAVACAVALQTAMAAFAEIALPNGETGRLTIKIGIATGEVRRLVVGADYWLDVLAGETVNRTAVAEQLAIAPEIILDQTTIAALGSAISLSEWRTSDETGERFGVLGDFTGEVDVLPVEPLPELGEEITRPWLDPLVYEQEKTGYALLQTEFRPCVALFVRFMGINYQADTAANQLNQFIRPLQAILAHYEGTLIDLTFGDKGSYVYVNFGALTIHEDDARRAVKTALRLHEVAQTLPFLQPLQIGITRGVMRTGAYGGVNRRHYGALADEVNVAARLMSTAVGGQILVSEAIYHATQSDFRFEPHHPLRLKGKTTPITPYRLTATQPTRPPLLRQPTYTLPMVGRQAELTAIAQQLDLTAAGASQIVGLVGEAGLGKSRLAAEALRLAHGRGFASDGGACQADGLNTPYLVWKPIWSSFFGLDPQQPPATQIQQLGEQVRRYAPQRAEALPLLGRLLDLPIPENGWTAQLEPKNRQTALHALLEDCLKQACATSPRLILIEDLHWIDALSHDLLVELAQSCTAYPLLFLIVYRPTTLPRGQVPRLEARPNFTPIPLSALDEREARQLIQAKLHQLYPTRGQAVSPTLVQKLLARAEGNPFYLEELLNFLHGRGLDPREAASWEMDLPDSLHALILSRLDQLQPSQRQTMRVASVIGRLFPVSWLIGYYPTLGNLPEVQTDLAELHALDLTLRDSTEAELAYLFKHIITHEVTYESLPFATRADLHERLAAYLEQRYAPTPPLETLAFHYGRSDNTAKQIEYLRRAGEAAQKSFAGDAALNFYGALLPLLSDDPDTQWAIYLQRGQVLEVLGQWAEAASDYEAALAIADDKPTAQSRAQFALGKLHRLRGEYETSLNWLGQAREIQQAANDRTGLVETVIETGTVFWRQGSYPEAREWLNQGLVLAQEKGDTASVALAFNTLGLVELYQGDYSKARTLFEESLRLRREMEDKQGIAASLTGLGIVAYYQGDYPVSRALFEECLSLEREIGDKKGIGDSVNNLGNVVSDQGDYVAAQALYEESLRLGREMGSKQSISGSLNNLGLVLLNQGEYATAQGLFEEGMRLKQEMGDKRGVADAFHNLGIVALNQGEYAVARVLHEQSLGLEQEMGDQQGVAVSLNYLGYAALLEEDVPKAQALFVESLAISKEMGLKSKIVWNLIGLAAVAGATNNHGRALSLASAAEALRLEVGGALTTLLQGIYEKVVANTELALGKEAFTAGWQKGEALNLEQAIQYALEETNTHE